MVDYTDLIEAAIQRETNTIGERVALRQARSVSGLEIDDDGNVKSLEGDGKDVLERVVEAYTEISGDVAASLIGRKINQDFAGRTPDLPQVLAEA